MIDQVVQYLNDPKVFSKIASMYPNAATGVPSDVPKGISLSDAVMDLSARAYYQRKEAQLILEGLKSLKEVCDD